MSNMSTKQYNAASAKTRRAIREEFARLLYRYKSIDKISVTQLALGAGVSRSTFYTHYTSIADVAADIKNETLRVFFDHQRIKDQASAEMVIASIYRYLKKNDRIFKLMFKSPAATDFALELGQACRERMLDQIHHNFTLKDTNLLDLEVSIFADGLALLCIRYYRGELETTLEEIFECAQMYGRNLITHRGSDLK